MERGIRALYVALVALYVALACWAAVVLPDRVPAHWSASSGPDRWSSRTETVVMFAVVGVLVPGLLGAMMWFIPRSRSLAGLNVPNRAYWMQPQNLPRARAMAGVDLGVLACLGVAFCCLLPPAIVTATRSEGHALPWWMVSGLVLFLAGSLGYCAWMVLVRWRVPR